MEDAAQGCIIRALGEVAGDSEDRIDRVERAGRAAGLIGDDTDLVAGFGQAQHGATKFLPKGLETQAVRRIAWSGVAAATERSPSSLLRP